MRSLTLVAVIILAGCAGNDGPDEPLTCPEGQEVQVVSGIEQCAAPMPPATVAIGDVPALVYVYSTIQIEWTLGTHQEEAHAMRTELRASTTPVADAALAGPDAYGAKVGAGHEHQNFMDGATYADTFAPEQEGIVYLRAYALVNSQDIWSPEVQVEVSAVTPTDVVHAITVTAGGPAASADPAEQDIALGDSVRFDNQDLLPRTFSWSGPAQIPDQSVQPLGSSEAQAFLVPGTYTFTSDDVVPVGGTVTVRVPS